MFEIWLQCVIDYPLSSSLFDSKWRWIIP